MARRSKNKNFECDMILGLIHIEGDLWLFGGVYKNLGVRKVKRGRYKYITELVPGQEDIIGRIIVKYKREFRASYPWGPNLENKLKIVEILESPYSIEKFATYDTMCISHGKLKLVVSKPEPSWKSALSSVKGIYLIADTSNGKKYVGSATGEEGIWGRLCEYEKKGHGGNIELKKLLSEKGKEHVNNFQYSILQIMDRRVSKEQIAKREKYWKDVLLSRDSQFGYNSN